jgi:hypothetical protein
MTISMVSTVYYVAVRTLHGKKLARLLTVTVSVTESTEPPIRFTGGGR